MNKSKGFWITLLVNAGCAVVAVFGVFGIVSGEEARALDVALTAIGAAGAAIATGYYNRDRLPGRGAPEELDAPGGAEVKGE